MDIDREQMPHILVVDDQSINLQVVESILLGAKKYKVSLLQSGHEALELMESMVPELILLDVVMPDMGGYKLCQQLKLNSRLSGVPVIFLSASSGMKAVIEGFDVGGVDYITKPFDPSVLLARVATHIALHRYHQKEEEMRQQERDFAYKNGLTEMGATVLHNIGNALVGVVSHVKQISNLTGDIRQLGLLLEKARVNYDEDGDLERLQQVFEISSKLLQEEYGCKLGEESAQLIHAAEKIHHIMGEQRKMSNGREWMSSWFSIPSLISDMTMLLGEELEGRGIELTIDGGSELPDVFLPRSPLGQMVVNLIKNSYEAIDQRADQGELQQGEGKLLIKLDMLKSSEENPAFWQLTIQDNGIGINVDHQQKVFQLGFTTKLERGGLGLHSAANFIASMGGIIGVSSDGMNVGAKVKVKLPLECTQNCHQLETT
ncbi:MAG: response regulator [Gammaproteobacteria bacterium]|nr:response regulator [Gammaproteobacteria bacterium]